MEILEQKKESIDSINKSMIEMYKEHEVNIITISDILVSEVFDRVSEIGMDCHSDRS
jgi:hypothetical protein